MSQSKPAGRKPADSSARTRGMIIRVVVWGGVAVMALLTLLDMRSRVAAQGTRDAWIAAQDEKIKQNKDLHRSDLDSLIQGSPRLPPEEAPADRHQTVCRSMLKYTWPGILRSYTINVYLGLGDDASVEYIEGPGKVAEGENEPPAFETDAPAEQPKDADTAEPEAAEPEAAEKGTTPEAAAPAGE